MEKRFFSYMLMFLLTVNLVACSENINTESNQGLYNQSNSEKAIAHQDISIPDDMNNRKIDTIQEYTQINERLCTDNEDIVISFEIQDSSKILTVCKSKDESYLLVRFGTSKAIDFEFPKNKSNTWDYFTYGHYLRGGGKQNSGLDLNELKFEDESYKYCVYQNYSAGDNYGEESISVGIIITNKTTEEEIDYMALKDSIVGYLYFGENERIKKVSI